MQQVKRIVPWTLLAFFIYAVVVSPSQAADLVRAVWDIIVQAFTSIGSFFNALLNTR